MGAGTKLYGLETLGVRVWPNPVWFETYQEEVDQQRLDNRQNELNKIINF